MKTRAKLLVQPSIFDVSQNHIASQLIKFCKFQKRDKEFIKKLEDEKAFCAGITQLTLYGLWLETQPKQYRQGEVVPRDDWTWINKTLQEISKAKTEEAFSKISSDIDRLLSLIQQHQSPEQYLEFTTQREYEKYFEDTAKRKLQTDYTIAGTFTERDLYKEIKDTTSKEESTQTTTLLDALGPANGSAVHIGSSAKYPHATGFFKHEDVYYYYNSNHPAGIRSFAANQKKELAKAIFEANYVSLNEAIAMDMRFVQFSYEQQLKRERMPQASILEQTDVIQNLSAQGFQADHHPLHASILERSSGSFQFYLKKMGKEKLNEKNFSDVTPLMTAMLYRRMEFVEALLAEENIQITADTLIEAIKYQNVDAVRLLMQSGKLTHAMKENALHYAASEDYYMMIAPLLEVYPPAAPIDIHTKQKGLTPYQVAVAFGNIRSAVALLRHGEDLKEAVEHREVMKVLLFETAKRGPLDLFKKLTSIIKNIPKYRDENNVTLLHYAASNGQKDTVEYLLNKDEIFREHKTTYADNQGDTPLHHAARFGHVPTIQLLLYDIGVQNKQGSTPLHEAVRLNQASAVKALLEAKAPAELPNKKGLTPFDVAIANGNAQIVQLFLDAKVKIKDDALAVAIKKGHVDVVKALLNAGVPPGDSLNVAISQGNAALVDALLSAKISVNTQMLTHAVVSANSEVLSRLMQEVKDINPVVEDQTYLLHRAAQQKNPEVIKLFFKDNVDLNVCDAKGNTALHLAVGAGNFEVFEQLINNPNVDINAKNADGLTPLELAYRKKGEGEAMYMAEALLNKNAVGEVDALAVDGKGKSLFHFAVEMGHVELFTRWLEEKRFSIDAPTKAGTSPLLLSVETGNIAVMEALIKLGANVNFARSQDKMSPLYRATERIQLNMVKCLVDAGADVNQSVNGFTALQVAIERKNYAAADLLLSRNANVLTEHEGFVKSILRSSTDKNAHSGILFKAAKQGHVHLMRFLISEKVDINMNINGLTPATIAIRNGDLKMTKLLLEKGAKIPKEALQLTEHHSNRNEMRELLKFKLVTPDHVKELQNYLAVIAKKYKTPVVVEALKTLAGKQQSDQVKYFEVVNKLCDHLSAPPPKAWFFRSKTVPGNDAIYGALQIIATKDCPVPLNMPAKKYPALKKDFFASVATELKRATPAQRIK